MLILNNKIYFLIFKITFFSLKDIEINTANIFQKVLCFDTVLKCKCEVLSLSCFLSQQCSTSEMSFSHAGFQNFLAFAGV